MQPTLVRDKFSLPLVMLWSNGPTSEVDAVFLNSAPINEIDLPHGANCVPDPAYPPEPIAQAMRHQYAGQSRH